MAIAHSRTRFTSCALFETQRTKYFNIRNAKRWADRISKHFSSFEKPNCNDWNFLQGGFPGVDSVARIVRRSAWLNVESANSLSARETPRTNGFIVALPADKRITFSRTPWARLPIIVSICTRNAQSYRKSSNSLRMLPGGFHCEELFEAPR